MSRLIDADELKKRIPITHADEFENCRNCSLLCDWEVEDLVDDAPTIDAVEVVRCKDCKFWQDQEEGVIEVPICARPENKYEKLPFRFMIGKDGFCSRAERRTDE